MKGKLTKKDYIKILNFYNIRIPNTKYSIEKESEKILASKLCKCIKEVDSKIHNEPRSIGICTKTIFNKKGLTRGKFKCKNKASVNFNKTRKIRK
jgi:hypothetical protein